MRVRRRERERECVKWRSGKRKADRSSIFKYFEKKRNIQANTLKKRQDTMR